MRQQVGKYNIELRRKQQIRCKNTRNQQPYKSRPLGIVPKSIHAAKVEILGYWDIMILNGVNKYPNIPPQPLKTLLAAQLLMPTPNSTTETELMGIKMAATNGDKLPTMAKLKPIAL